MLGNKPWRLEEDEETESTRCKKKNVQRGDRMIKLFVSQPMTGLSDDEIMKARYYAVREAERKIRNKTNTYTRHKVLEVIDSFFQDAPTDAKHLWYLGESLKKLSEADVVIFAKNWQKSRGCKIEHEAAVAYGIEVMYE